MYPSQFPNGLAPRSGVRGPDMPYKRCQAHITTAHYQWAPRDWNPRPQADVGTGGRFGYGGGCAGRQVAGIEPWQINNYIILGRLRACRRTKHDTPAGGGRASAEADGGGSDK